MPSHDSHRTTSDSPIAALLGAHHHELDGVLTEVAELARQRDFRAAADRFASLDRPLRRHIYVEDEMLLRTFDGLVGSDGAATSQVLRQEHARIKDLLEEVGQGLAAFEDVDRSVTELRDLLAAHNGKEEAVVYPTTDHKLGASERGRLLTQMASFLSS